MTEVSGILGLGRDDVIIFADIRPLKGVFQLSKFNIFHPYERALCFVGRSWGCEGLSLYTLLLEPGSAR